LCSGHYVKLEIGASASSYNTDELRAQFEVRLTTDVATALSTKWPTITYSDFLVVNFTQIRTGVVLVTVQVLLADPAVASDVVDELVTMSTNTSSSLYSGVLTSNLASASDGGSINTNPITPTDPSQEQSTNWTIIGGGIGGGVVAVGIIAGIICYFRRTTTDKKQLKKMELQTTTPKEVQLSQPLSSPTTAASPTSLASLPSSNSLTSLVPHPSSPVSASSSRPSPPPRPTSPPSPWIKHLDPTSKAPYYYNTVTGESMWEKPAGYRGV